MADIMGSAELDELDHSSAESLNEYEVESEEDHESGDEAEKTWKAQQLHEQCRDVMDALTRNMRRWDENTGTEGVPVLEEYKKITLATGKAGTYPRIETALHTLARDKLLFGNLQPDIRSKLVQYLWDHRSTYSDSGHDSSVTGDPVLAVALRSDNGVFIDCVEKCLGDSFPMLLSLQDGEGKNCIHHLFFWDQANNRDRRSKDRILGQMERLAPRADAGTLATADTNGNTPIHYALDYNQCLNKPDKYVEIVKAMVQSADAVMRESGTVLNKFGDSPILYGYNTARKAAEALKKAKESKSQAEQQMSVSSDNPSTCPAETNPVHSQPRQKLRGEGEKTVRINNAANKNSKVIDTPPGRPLRRESTAALNSEVPPMTTPKGHISRQKEQQAHSHPVKQIPSGLKEGESKDISRNKEGTNPARVTSKSKAFKDIRDFLTVHYIRTRSDADARTLIYGRNASGLVRNLYFDAIGQQDAQDITDLLQRMSDGGFGTTLAYVNLPTVRFNPPRRSSAELSGLPRRKVKPKTNQKSLPENPGVGRTELVQVFKKLYDLNVRSILRLSVEDRQSPSHTDAAIEEALQGRESITDGAGSSRPIAVEKWDWRKPDLSTDVIAFAAPTVEHVNLYWSGNQAVLKAWECTSGIPKLYSATGGRLKSVTIHAAPGLETRDRMFEKLNRFQEEVKNNTQGELAVEFWYWPKGLLADMDTNRKTAGLPVDDTVEELHHSWVQTMEEFCRTLRILPKLEEVKAERVKLALIDDGVNLSAFQLHQATVKVIGLSFFPPDRGFENPWHCSSNGHGTIMANMIVRINPWVELYVIRVQNGESSDGGSTISAGSAANAIRAAINLQVNIISISWTIKHQATARTTIAPTSTRTKRNTGGQTQECSGTERLETAIDEAVGEGILMFCSASDDIQTGAMDTLPYQRQPNYIFRIGAAHAHGQRDSVSEDVKRIDYYFPGNQVAEAKNPRSPGPVKYHSGSSVSTALAAGLASLIIYCARLSAKKAPQNSQDKARFATLAEQLRLRDNMKRALDNIRADPLPEEKFLPVWSLFKRRGKQIDNAKDQEKWDGLFKLVMDLGHGIEE